jgi:hypothetical protein
MRRGVTLLTALICAGSATWGLAENADSTQRREDQIKAGYLFNFAKFVEWPPTKQIVNASLGVVGASGIQEALTADSTDKRIGARRLTVRSLRETDTPEGCNVLYVDAKAVAAVRSNGGAMQQAMLTVSDAKDFTHDGGIITLFTDKNRLRFIVNVENAQRAGLHISSNLLQLASSVEKAGAR